MKVAPLHRALVEDGAFESMIVHTGQHYDERMSEVFFRQLELPEPDVYLGVGGGSHAEQTARIMVAFEEVVLVERPDLVVVVGDVNSTLACSLVAAKLHVPVAHVEAGLRSGDRRMPEEINRIVTDHLSDYLFVTERSGLDNLKAEGVPEEKAFFVGNVMIDALVRFREKAAARPVLEDLGLEPRRYVLMTMHRPSNVDVEGGLRALLKVAERLADVQRLVFPIHPRTRRRFREFGLEGRLEAIPDLVLLEPLGYLEFLNLMGARHRRRDGLGRDSGGDHLPPGSLPDATGEYGAPSHGRAGDEPADADGGGPDLEAGAGDRARRPPAGADPAALGRRRG